MLCRSCSATDCRNISTERDRIEIECPVCDGHGCKECGEGAFEIDGCPNQFCNSVVTSIDLFELFEKGLPPVAGGVLDQSASFIRAASFYRSEQHKVRHERSSRNTDKG